MDARAVTLRKPASNVRLLRTYEHIKVRLGRPAFKFAVNVNCVTAMSNFEVRLLAQTLNSFVRVKVNAPLFIAVDIFR